MPEDYVAVGVERHGYAAPLHQALDQQEVVATVFLLAEEGVNHRAVASSTAISNANGGAWSPSHGR